MIDLLRVYSSGFVSMAACGLILPVSLWLAQRWNIYDLPGALKIHARPIPRVGGMAMFLGLFAGIGVSLPSLRPYGLSLLAFTLIWLVGFVDDLRGVPWFVRLGVQICAGSLLWIGGWRLGWSGLSVVDCVLTCLFVAFVVNSMNLLDGLDGIAAGTAAIAALGFVPLFMSAGDYFSAALACSVAGTCVAVLFLNFPPARIFMGDSGSTLLGVVLAFLMLAWVRTESSATALVPVGLFLVLPLADAGFAIVRRFRMLASPFEGDRRHFYDLLLRRGWTARRVLAWSLSATGIAVLAGWATIYNSSVAPFITIALLVFTAWQALRLGSFRSEIAADLGRASSPALHESEAEPLHTGSN